METTIFRDFYNRPFAALTRDAKCAEVFFNSIFPREGENTMKRALRADMYDIYLIIELFIRISLSEILIKYFSAFFASLR
jgi:hypothetical protein